MKEKTIDLKNHYRNIAIIPARGGSKRIHKKNIKIFHGKPIIAWAIEMALKSSLFERVIVSTDCEEIAEVSRNFGAEVPFIRPKNLSDDFTSVLDVVRHSIKVDDHYDNLMQLTTLIYPTAPLLDKCKLEEAINSIKNYDFALSVTQFSYPVQRALSLNKKYNTVEMIDKNNFIKRSQDLPSRYHDAGQFVVGKSMRWLSGNPMLSGKTIPIFIPPIRVQDIDNQDDWDCAELKFSLLEGKKNYRY